MERTYRATPDEVWDLWTTKAGIESWWGPDGFSVTVRHLDLRADGELHYTMTATAPEQIEFMNKAGMPMATDSSITYTEVEPKRRLSYVMTADFVPDTPPYDVATTVSLDPHPDGVRMTLTFDAMHDEQWTERAVMGHEGELAKLERVLRTS
jgi:uncharacterized protein YndB with AHSA1/START domain